MADDGHINWETVINSLDAPDLDGKIQAPSSETIQEENTVDLNKKVAVQKIITEVYVYTDTDTQRFLPLTTQQVILLGEMTKKEFLQLVDRKKKR